MKKEIIYQIYWFTFGNAEKIIESAEYIKSLGVTTIWLSPIHPWNKNGFGYDITDYGSIDPQFGTLEDLTRLCSTYHRLGIKVYMDQVYNHCSMEHHWFQNSVEKIAPYTDYFVWHDALGFDDNGNPIAPTNWPSTWDCSGESAWTWNEERQQFYLHSFDYSMPNLNLNNPAVIDEIKDCQRLYYSCGVDGNRLDASAHYGYDPSFPNNPLDENGKQRRLHDINTLAGTKFLDELKTLGNSYATPKHFLAEYVFDKGTDGNEKGINVIRNSKCDSFYIGSFLGGFENIREKIEKSLQVSPNGEKLNWAFSNHDMERVATRYWGDNFTPQKSAMIMDLLCKLPGSICLFQGDELGMPNPMNIEDCKTIKDGPHGDMWKNVGMPWDGARAGFCFTPESHKDFGLHPDKRQTKFCVANQEDDPNSTLNSVRRSIAERRDSFLSDLGDMQFLDTENQEVIAFIRTSVRGNEKAICLYNFSDKETKVKHQNTEYVLGAETFYVEFI